MTHVLLPAENASDAWNMLTLDPLSANDSRYVDCSVARGRNVVKTLSSELSLHSTSQKYMHLLFTGYTGDGKTTELYQFIASTSDKYRPLYFNAQKEFDLNDFRFPDFLLGIAKAVFESMNEQDLSLPDRLLDNVANWFAKIVVVIERKKEAELKAEVGASSPKWFQFLTAKLVSTIKAGGQQREEVRKELNLSLTQPINLVDQLLSATVNVSMEFDNREPIIIFDNLDRLQEELAFDLFYRNGQNLCDLNCHFIYVVPRSLLYHPEATLSPFKQQTMRMIPVRSREGSENEANIAHLTRALEHRFVPHKIMADAEIIMRTFILASGGHLRDLIRLLLEACRDALGEPDEKINARIAQRTINALCETYQMVVNEDDYEHLIKTHQTNEVDSNERTQRLIHSNVILVYHDEDGTPWHDVHPALVQGRKFQKSLEKVT